MGWRDNKSDNSLRYLVAALRGDRTIQNGAMSFEDLIVRSSRYHDKRVEPTNSSVVMYTGTHWDYCSPDRHEPVSKKVENQWLIR